MFVHPKAAEMEYCQAGQEQHDGLAGQVARPKIEPVPHSSTSATNT